MSSNINMEHLKHRQLKTHNCVLSCVRIVHRKKRMCINLSKFCSELNSRTTCFVSVPDQLHMNSKGIKKSIGARSTSFVS